MQVLLRLVHIPPHTTENHVIPYRDPKRAWEHLHRLQGYTTTDWKSLLEKLEYEGYSWRYQGEALFKAGADEWWAVKADLYEESTPYGPSSP